MSNRIKAFLNSYRSKEATAGDFLSALGERGAEATKSALIFAPLAGGALAGFAASKLTSPEGKSKVLQKALVTRELESALAQIERRKAIAAVEGTANARKPERSLHI